MLVDAECGGVLTSTDRPTQEGPASMDKEAPDEDKDEDEVDGG